YDLVVISNATRDFIDFKLKVDDLEKYFSRVFSTTSDFNCIKGDSKGYLGACNRMGIAPGGLIHIGDDYHFDYLAARNVGIDAYFLMRDGGNREKENHSGPEGKFPVEKGKSVRDLEEFANIILSH
ncbi:MAG: HAD family hydrolase, partial [Candidatus Micrarchaeota archaeon]